MINLIGRTYKFWLHYYYNNVDAIPDFKQYNKQLRDIWQETSGLDGCTNSRFIDLLVNEPEMCNVRTLQESRGA
jgi:hypothetical protein